MVYAVSDDLDTENDRLVFRLTLENTLSDIPEPIAKKLAASGINTSVEYEDSISYIGFVFPEGGEKA